MIAQTQPNPASCLSALPAQHQPGPTSSMLLESAAVMRALHPRGTVGQKAACRTLWWKRRTCTPRAHLGGRRAGCL